MSPIYIPKALGKLFANGYTISILTAFSELTTGIVTKICSNFCSLISENLAHVTAIRVKFTQEYNVGIASPDADKKPGTFYLSIYQFVRYLIYTSIHTYIHQSICPFAFLSV
jgi:hypothetical protein